MIDTDEILNAIREWRPSFFSDKLTRIKINSEDFRYLLSNIGFPIDRDKYGKFSIFGLCIVEDESINLGEFKLLGVPRLKKWQ